MQNTTDNTNEWYSKCNITTDEINNISPVWD